ncbi:hypothetical protein [Streptomyces sp. TS71-3]|uniref:hypothetical protein n=1 Tax=Streptomyces sp. TS71-3 TaxID=2733862 RepID=UPI001BB2F3DF|nr:hypothetical protein [Streptomyces sp. TS71-3]
MKYGILAAAPLLLLPLLAHQASAGEPLPYTDSQMAAMSPDRQAKVLAPLRQAAQSATMVGQGQRQDVFSGAEIAPGYRGVNVYLTSLKEADSFLRDMRRSATKPGSAHITFKQGQHTRAELHETITSLHDEASDLPFTMLGASAAVDGSKITVLAKDTGAARTYFGTRRSAVPVDVQQGTTATPTSRESDTAPFYGGAALGGSLGGPSYCTSGIPAISTWDGRQWLVTAGHCYNVNDVVYTNGPVITINDPDSRQINGIVSGHFTSDLRSILWVDVGDIFNAFAIKLNPS